GTLSGGEQQMLAIARGLLARPRILMLDEPSMGLAPQLVRQIFDLVAAIHREGTTILLVEQNARLALAVSDHAYVLERGRIALEGPSKALAGAALSLAGATARAAAGPATAPDVVAAAEKEGKVVVYSTTDSSSTAPLVKDFNALYPKIAVEYDDMNSTEVYNRFVSEAAAGAGTGDLLWSSSMDLQVK